ncbi:uncharacterized protein B0T15DRAFT_107138 [Chaetomium strumarium]|uniref:Uncharacterized protein n=1 Tax=Chaetomium strumarium TaxID=1170767 RepID=A0AAJ0GYA6_9PEZI|nr:hypothetical protein B0T15DRAFT_107138 [Chaetomium strumarium]
MVAGNSSKMSSRHPQPLLRPQRGSPQERACSAFEVTLIQVFLQEGEDGKLRNNFNSPHQAIDVPSVYDFIYEGDRGVSHASGDSRPDKLGRDSFICRWLHLPANNEQWVRDLFISMGIQDHSMIDQRYQGSRLINRYMIPQAKKYKYTRRTDHQLSIAMQPELAEQEAVVIFMPILGFEKHGNRKKLSQAFCDVQVATAQAPVHDADEAAARLLLSGYLASRGVAPVHCRRTLDQFSYYMLESTERRDNDQVTYKWAENQKPQTDPDGRPVVMVDQLWLWALQDGTVITSFPNTWNQDEEFNLRKVFVDELLNNEDWVIQSTEDLLHLVLKTSLDFFGRKGPQDCRFYECFQSHINNVSEHQRDLYRDFRGLTRDLQDQELTPAQKKQKLERLLSLDMEMELLGEILDIQDELSIVNDVLTQQEVALNELRQLYTEQDHASITNTGIGKGKMKDLGVETPVTNQVTLLSAGQEPHILWDRGLMHKTMLILTNNFRAISDLSFTASKVERMLQSLLNLKQRQAQSWEARFAREGSEETQRQGKMILFFTIVTIISLPLMFMASFFALDVDAWPKDAASGETKWQLGQVSSYLFGVSAGVSIPLILVAFYMTGYIGSHPTTRHKYAPIFGDLTFHTKIPVLHHLWKYRQYHRTSRVVRKAQKGKHLYKEVTEDKYIADYPLHYYTRKGIDFFGDWLRPLLAVLLACLCLRRMRRQKLPLPESTRWGSTDSADKPLSSSSMSLDDWPTNLSDETVDSLHSDGEPRTWSVLAKERRRRRAAFRQFRQHRRLDEEAEEPEIPDQWSMRVSLRTSDPAVTDGATPAFPMGILRRRRARSPDTELGKSS